MNCRQIVLPLVALASFFLTGLVLAQQAPDESKPDPIDAEIQHLLDKNPSTGGQVQAFAEGLKIWDAELNRVYTKLTKTLPEKEREELKQAQRNWVAFRDSERHLIGTVYRHMDGTMYRPMAVSDDMELTKARAKQLRGYLQLLTEESSADAT